MSLDARSIAIGVSVVLLGVIGWMLVANSDESPSETSVEAVSTTIAPISLTTTSVTATTTSAPTTVAPTTTAATTTTVAITTTTVPANATSSSPPTKDPWPGLDEEPDLTMCRENDIPDRQCRWVGVEYPLIDTEADSEPLEYLRQYTTFLNWASANPEIGRDLLFVAVRGELLEDVVSSATEELSRGEVDLLHVSVEGPIETVSEEDDSFVLEATIIRGRHDTIIEGELDSTADAMPPQRWQFEVVNIDDGWRVVDMGATE